MSLIVDGANAVSSFVIFSKVHWHVVVPLDNTTSGYEFLRMFT